MTSSSDLVRMIYCLRRHHDKVILVESAGTLLDTAEPGRDPGQLITLRGRFLLQCYFVAFGVDALTAAEA